MIDRNESLSLKSALKGLCTAFLKKPRQEPNKGSSCNRSVSGDRKVCIQQVQQALLCLPPGEMLVVILREMWWLSYLEIAALAGLDENAVANLLAAGRRGLRSYLFPPAPKRASDK